MRPYTLLRARRKTVGIYITDAATVEVRAPTQMPVADIERLLAEKEGWIARAIDARTRSNAARAAFRLDYGATLPLRGQERPIRARAGDRIGLDEEGFYLPPGLTHAQMLPALIQIYKIMAGNILRPKVAQFARRMGVSPTRVTITSAKTRWGSCSGRDSLSFSWRLVMAGDEAIDYVVVHELAHIKQHNHSPQFWAEVAAVLPDYEARRAQLKTLQSKLALEGWE